MGNFKQNGIDFTISNNLQAGEKLHNVKGKIQSGNYQFVDYEADDASKLINAVEIDWNEAVLPNVSLSNLTSYNHVISTGDLLCLINDMQSRLSA